MARKKKRKKGKVKPVIPRRLEKALAEVDGLVNQKHWAEAQELLEELDRRYPKLPEVLSELAYVCFELGDTERYQFACERLLEVDPDDADALLWLADAYLSNSHLALSLQAFRQFHLRWPDHESAEDARETIAILETDLPKLLTQKDMTKDEAFELALQHDQTVSYMEQGRYHLARRTAEKILRHYPEFAPAHNNLGQAHWLEGRYDKAIASTEQVLAFDQENVHALSNLARYWLLKGGVERAQVYAEQLKASTALAADLWYKKAEALSFLGDDEGVLEIFEQAGDMEESFLPPILFHLAGVAAQRLGRAKDARRFWKKALKLNPGLSIAEENLADLRRPVGERHGPWPFSGSVWVSQKVVQELVQFIGSATHRKDDEAITRAARRFLRKYPNIGTVVPLLLDRGDEWGREFAIGLARMAETSDLLEALKDFALGQRGPDQLRLEAAQFLVEEGLLPSGSTRMWVEGEWRELLLLDFEIHGEPEHDFSPRVEKLAVNAMIALRDEDGERAERALKQALALEPETPELQNNLAMAYEMQGRFEEAEALVEQVYERHPDYLFARVGVARLSIRRGEVERARELLDPLLHQSRMHFSEFDAFCAAQVDLHLAEKNKNAARSWFEMWESSDPDNPKLDQFRLRLGILLP